MMPLASRLHSIHRGISAREIQPFTLTALNGAVKALGDCATVDPPPAFDRLERLRKKIYELLSSDTAILKLGASEWLDAPWLSFEVWDGHALCQEPRFRDGLSLAAKASPHVGKRCIHVFLRDYDPFAPRVAESLRDVILETLSVGHLSLAGWNDRNRRLKIFDPDGGPATVMSNLLSQHSSKPLTQCLDDSGLSVGGFSFAMLLEWCRRAHSRPWETQEVIDTWMHLCSGSVAGRVFKIVECLLDPWRSNDPDKEWRTSLLAWLQKHHGDPREAVSGVWPQVDAELRGVAIRWLTLQTIEGFFEVLDDYALRRGDDTMQRQWPYRKAFWLAYYHRGVVLDAKAAVGRDMEDCLGWQMLQSRFGNRIARLEEFEMRQSALLLKLRGVVVFEGTHNTSCRLWDDTSPNAPELLNTRFRRSDIIANPRTDLRIDPFSGETGISHMGSENGTWQRKLRDFLGRKIGVMISETELMP
jgi:hypothetical protein